MKKVIDIAHYQGKVDFEKVKKAGYSGVIIKAGGSDSGYYMDSKFNEYYEGAKNASLNIGTYYFNGKNCLSKLDGKEDAIRFMNIIKGKKFDLPVYMDIEAQPTGQKDNVTEAIFGFCEELEKNGYYVGVYASDIAGFKEKINYDKIKDRFSIWVARYGSKPTYATKYDMWQYSESGVVSGINDNKVDLNECYKDFSTIIKNGGYNGYTKANNSDKKETKPTKKSNEELAKEVLKGKWGNGEERKKRLTDAGYNYNEVQKLVNEMCKNNKVEYYPKCSLKYTSIVDALDSIGVDSSKANRKKIAQKNNIKDYIGTTLQNIKMLNKLKIGRLRKV